MPAEPSRRRGCAALCALLALWRASAALAAGSDAEVRVVKFAATSDTDYTLVVEPLAPAAQPGNSAGPYMAHCQQLTVEGTFAKLAGFALQPPSMVTPHAHAEAIAYLRTAALAHATIRLGWMGQGFLVDASDPCLVRSRALVLMRDGARRYEDPRPVRQPQGCVHQFCAAARGGAPGHTALPDRGLSWTG
jgi:hypothetical protein